MGWYMRASIVDNGEWFIIVDRPFTRLCTLHVKRHDIWLLTISHAVLNPKIWGWSTSKQIFWKKCPTQESNVSHDPGQWKTKNQWRSYIHPGKQEVTMLKALLENMSPPLCRPIPMSTRLARRPLRLAKALATAVCAARVKWKAHGRVYPPHRIHGAGIYANIGGILMVNVTIYSIHGSYGLWQMLTDVASWKIPPFFETR